MQVRSALLRELSRVSVSPIGNTNVEHRTRERQPALEAHNDSIRAMRIPRALLHLGLIVVFVTVPLAAGPATGLITGGGKSLKVVDAFALDAVGQFGDPVIRVRLSDRLLDRKGLGTVIDVAFELDAQRGTAGYLDLFVDKKTGAYAGATYELGAGVRCAL